MPVVSAGLVWAAQEVVGSCKEPLLECEAGMRVLMKSCLIQEQSTVLPEVEPPVIHLD